MTNRTARVCALAAALVSPLIARADGDRALQSALVQSVVQQWEAAAAGASLPIHYWGHESDTDKLHLMAGVLGSFGDGSRGAYYALSTLPSILCWATEVASHTADGQDRKALDSCGNTSTAGGLSKLLGKGVLKGTVAPADPKWIPAYDAAALQALFDKLYLPPSATLVGLSMQKLYDTTFKDSIAGFIETLLAVATKKGAPEGPDSPPGLENLTPRYLAAYAKWVPSSEKYNPGILNKMQKTLKVDGRTLGTILRRYADGTLPTVVTLLLKVLKDYDPKQFALVDAPLRAAKLRASP